MSTLLILASLYTLIDNSFSCSHYTQRSPIPPFDEVARIPLGVCTGNHYYHNKINQESAMYLCSDDNDHIIKYTYSDSAKCSGDYSTSIVTRNPTDFVCDAEATCPYVIVKVHNKDTDTNDWRRWYSTAFVIDHCQNGEVYSCKDNTGYLQNKFDNEQCEGYPTEVVSFASDEYLEEEKDGLYEIYCNQPDPVSSIVNIPSTDDFKKQDDKFPVSAIESAVCMNGRSEGQHVEMTHNMASYCFDGYDAFGKPKYVGDYGVIKWTQSAGSYGDSWGLFKKAAEGEPEEEYPMAYCFSDTPNLLVCTRNWFVDHGTSPRYYKDENLEVSECGCNRHNVNSGDDGDAVEDEQENVGDDKNQDDDEEDEADDLEEDGRGHVHEDGIGHYDVHFIVLVIGLIMLYY